LLVRYISLRDALQVCIRTSLVQPWRFPLWSSQFLQSSAGFDGVGLTLQLHRRLPALWCRLLPQPGMLQLDTLTRQRLQ
jgi:hypothetical protein